jgi:HPr kinase/phosphorylase
LLVSDDQTALVVRGGLLVASAPAALAGLLELRGQGIISLPYADSVVVRLVVDLLPAREIERMPEERDLVADIAGTKVARIVLDQAQPAAPSIVRAILSSRLKLLPDAAQKA